MRKALVSVAAAASCLLFIVITIGHITIVAQSTITGEWHADARPDRNSKASKKDDSDDNNFGPGPSKGDINVQFEYRRSATNHNSFGSNYSFADLGLSPQQVQNGRVSFHLAREAGTVDAEGTFTDGRGTGTFTFTPNPGFLSAMKARGFDLEKDDHNIRFNSDDNDRDTVSERLLSAALLNVTTALADDLNSANFGKLDTGNLYAAAIFHVDSKFMVEMKNTGFPNLKFDDLVKARIFKIDADYVRQVKDMGLGIDSFEGLVKYRIFKVTPAFLAELKDAGLTNINDEDVVKCRIFKIDGDFVRKARAQDPNATVEDMVRMKIGVHRIKADTWQ